MTVKDCHLTAVAMKLYNGFVYISNRLFEMASDERDDAADHRGFSRMMKVFNTSDDWVKFVYRPIQTTQASPLLLSIKTDHTRWKVASSMRKMKNSKCT